MSISSQFILFIFCLFLENTDSGVGQGVLLDHNDSGRFECRFVTVKVQSSPSIMLQGMEQTIFGIWSAHGEGKKEIKVCHVEV